jgi:D-alanyl-D-alanine carboxypeptidase
MTQAEILFYVAGVPQGRVGQFAYSNTNYILLGQLIEKLDGTELNASLRTRITGPLGLDDTFFDTGNKPVPEDLVGGWSPTGGSDDPTAPYNAIASSAWAARSLVSTTDDLASFLRALATGRLLSPNALATMTDFGTDGYGLGS